MKPIEIAKYYFDLSNKSDFEGIAKLFKYSTTYSSQSTGLFLGTDDIVAMQKNFHSRFSSLKWHINAVEEMKPGIVAIDFIFNAELPTGEKIISSGVEHVIVYEGKIQHIEVRNK